MTYGEMLYLLLVIVTFVGLAGVIAYVSERQAREQGTGKPPGSSAA